MAVDVKICGIKTYEALRAAADAGARYGGFVFMEPSRQMISPMQAHDLAHHVPASMKKVGLFVNASDDELRTVINQVPLDLIQLHGHETPGRVAEVRALTNLPVIIAICLATAEHLAPVPAYEAVADYLLFDTRIEGKPAGGTGVTFDWSLIANKRFKRPWMLAGGLNAGNISDAVRTCGARILDVSSGVENAAGEKDPEKIHAFLEVAMKM